MDIIRKLAIRDLLATLIAAAAVVPFTGYSVRGSIPYVQDSGEWHRSKEEKMPITSGGPAPAIGPADLDPPAGTAPSPDAGWLARTYCRAAGHTGGWTYPDERCVRFRMCQRCGAAAGRQEHAWSTPGSAGTGRCEQERRCHRCGMVESRALHTRGSWLYGLDSWYQFHVIELGALAALLAVPMGAVRGCLVTLAAAAVAVTAYLGVLRPRLVRWGASDEEVARPMPGDDIAAPGGRRTTRAVTIGVPAAQVWPWLAQLGYGRAGWYSDHLPGSGRRRSTAQIRPEWQQLGPGDRILVLPDSGFDVVAVEDGHYFVARTADRAMSWCVQVEPLDQHSCRLLSRWHARWFVIVTSARWTALSDPSSFAAERRMLLGIKERAERASPAGTRVFDGLAA